MNIFLSWVHATTSTKIKHVLGFKVLQSVWKYPKDSNLVNNRVY